ncbi:MAG: Eco57I restriction-modification methylase domain-containing protein, partial [Halobacteriales archaeon]
EARETRAEIEEKLKQVRARFDILAASRIDDEIDTNRVSDTEIDITKEDSYKHAQAVLESTDPVHFPESFPEVFDGDSSGFDVIIGNPPWEKTQIEEHEFWARYNPGLRGKSQREMEKLIDRYKESRPDLVEEFKEQKEIENKRAEILTNGPYPGTLL